MCSSHDCQGTHQCQCQLRGFLRAALLLLLRSGKSYGYTLQQELVDRGLQDKVDIGSLYRNLRSLENAGYVISEWQESSSGPEKRVYMITEAGLKHLQEWKLALQEKKEVIDTFLKMLQEDVG